MIFGKFALNKSGVVRATVETPSTTGIVNGAAYLDDEQGDSYACVSTAAVNAADGFIGGFRYTTAGALRVSDVTAGIPASNSINQGILMTDNGQVCFSGAAGTAVINGVSVTADGAVSMQVMAFLAEFEDLGAGAVDTAVTFGNVAATFTRATTATTVSSTGLIISVATGVARSYYDPTSLAYLGYLAEGARTNLCLQSEDLATTWVNTRSTETVNATVAPDGAATADKLVEDATAANSHFATQAFTFTAVVHTVSVFAKSAERTAIQLALNDGTTNHTANFNLATGAVGAVSNTTSTIKAYPNGWYRCTMSTNAATAAAAGTVSLILQNPAGTNTYDGDGVSGAFFWGAQLEAAAFASSYIPTTTAAVARNADVLTYPTTGWYSDTAGTILAEGTYAAATSANQALLQIDDGTATNRHVMYRAATTAVLIGQTDASGAQGSVSPTGAVTSASTKFSYAYKENDFAGARDGGTVATDATGTLPPGISTLRVGDNGTSTASMFGPIRRVAYYPSRLPNATLQSLTA